LQQFGGNLIFKEFQCWGWCVAGWWNRKPRLAVEAAHLATNKVRTGAHGSMTGRALKMNHRFGLSAGMTTRVPALAIKWKNRTSLPPPDADSGNA
jgi:hypothetical protein